VDIVALLPFLVLIGAMFLLTRSAKNKQRAAAQMRNQMQPGSGVRTIGGLYATVKEVNDDTVVVELSPGVHATFAKNAIAVVLEDEEYDRIVNGGGDDESLAGDDLADELPAVPDSPAGLEAVDLSKDREDDAEGEAPRANMRKDVGKGAARDEEGRADS
jgi:preprotein translocase subunit YajC